MTTTAAEEQTINVLGVVQSEMDVLLARATENLGAIPAETWSSFPALKRAQDAISEAHAKLGFSGKALADMAAEMRKPPKPVDPPYPEPTPGTPPGAMLPGQKTIQQMTEDDKLFVSNANPSIVDLSKLYAYQSDINIMYRDYNVGGSMYPTSGFDVNAYTGYFRR